MTFGTITLLLIKTKAETFGDKQIIQTDEHCLTGWMLQAQTAETTAAPCSHRVDNYHRVLGSR